MCLIFIDMFRAARPHCHGWRAVGVRQSRGKLGSLDPDRGSGEIVVGREGLFNQLTQDRIVEFLPPLLLGRNSRPGKARLLPLLRESDLREGVLAPQEKATATGQQ